MTERQPLAMLGMSSDAASVAMLTAVSMRVGAADLYPSADDDLSHRVVVKALLLSGVE